MDIDRLKSLAISESGFIFDPVTGHSYTSNETGMLILASVKDGIEPSAIAKKLSDEFDVPADEAERDVGEFVAALERLALV